MQLQRSNKYFLLTLTLLKQWFSNPTWKCDISNANHRHRGRTTGNESKIKRLRSLTEVKEFKGSSS
jgi:hypothetical protein